MDKKNTYIINVIGAPGVGKSIIAALLFVKLKLLGYVVEYVQEYAKNLVWTKDFKTLKNQYHVSEQQYTLFSQMVGEVDFIVTDGPLLHGLYYNRYEKYNVSDINKTETFILKSHHEFNNVNIFLNRGEYPYEQQGRMQNEKEARQIDIILKHILDKEKIPYKEFVSDVEDVDGMIKHVESTLRNESNGDIIVSSIKKD